MGYADSIRRRRLNTDEVYERFFDGYYNLERPGEILERNVVLGRPKVEVVAAPTRRTHPRTARSERSTASKAGIK